MRHRHRKDNGRNEGGVRLTLVFALLLSFQGGCIPHYTDFVEAQDSNLEHDAAVDSTRKNGGDAQFETARADTSRADVQGCKPNCVRKQCGPDGCGGNCGTCEDGNACTDDYCDAQLGCLHTYTSAPCDDDGNQCTTDLCENGACQHKLASSIPCDDWNQCTDGDTCYSGQCISGPPKNCDDGNNCTEDSCDEATGCKHMAIVPCCGDGVCEDGEDECSCPECYDVAASSYCDGDDWVIADSCGGITSSEDCAGGCSPGGCITGGCGDGTCDQGDENCIVCSDDCDDYGYLQITNSTGLGVQVYMFSGNYYFNCGDWLESHVVDPYCPSDIPSHSPHAYLGQLTESQELGVNVMLGSSIGVALFGCKNTADGWSAVCTVSCYGASQCNMDEVIYGTGGVFSNKSLVCD